MDKHVEHTLNQWRHRAQHTGRQLAGVGVRQSLVALVSFGASALGLAGTAFLTVGTGVFSLGIGTAIAHYLNHVEHQYRKQDMTNLYRRELASIAGVDPSEVTIDDLEAIAEKNPTLKGAIDKSRRIQNFNTVTWGIAAAAALVAVGLLAGPLAGVGLIGKAIVAGIAGYSAFKVAHTVAEGIGERLTDIDAPCIADRVRELEVRQFTGKRIAREQVMSVFVAAKPDLAAEIFKEYGGHYEDLSVTDQNDAALRLGKKYNIEELTNAINLNEFSAQELTFRIHGQESGASPDPTIKDRWKKGVTKAKENITHMKRKGYEAFQSFMGRQGEEAEQVQDMELAPQEAMVPQFQNRLANERGYEGQRRPDEIPKPRNIEDWQGFVGTNAAGGGVAWDKR